MSFREPEWDAEQRSMMAAFLIAEADLGAHGQPMSEATSAEADPVRSGGWRYEANQFPVIDWAERARQKAIDDYETRYPNADRTGQVWRVRRVEN